MSYTAGELKPFARTLVLLAFALPMGARAQGLPAPPAASSEAPESSWEAFPGTATPAPPPASTRGGDQQEETASRSAEAPPPAPARAAPSPAPWGDPSLFGARTLGNGRWAVGIYLGFPLAGIRAGVGLLPNLDAGLALDSAYGSMNEVLALVRWQVLQLQGWTLAVAAEGGPAFFSRPEVVEVRGARWLTGRRNWNLSPGVVASYQEDSKATRLFADVRAHLALDTEPFQNDPLGGIPPAVQVSGNYSIRVGAEAPLSGRTSYVVAFGLEVHGRSEDAPLMALVLLGLATSL